ncbi:MAG: hypothetical protein N3I35_19565 [Clostridia bacterium]|nr:hypothetical protein [Clostridia bacterium]
MESNYKPKMLKSVSEYLSKSTKFYDLKGEYTAPVVFVLVLAVNFLSYYLFGSISYDIDFSKPEGLENLKAASSQMILVFFVTNILTNLISAVYLHSYIRELKGEVCKLKDSIAVTGKNSIMIVFTYLTVFIYIPVYALLLKLPDLTAYVASGIFTLVAVFFIVLYFVLIFSTCYIQDKGSRIFSAFRASSNLTKGHKIEIFSIILIFKFLSLVFMFFAVSFVPAQDNGIIVFFVESFVSTIISLIEIRIVGLMYFDLEY